MLNPTHFVYRHVRNDTGEVFYIGKGKLRNGHPIRAFCKKRPNPIWHKIVNKSGGYKAEVIMLCRSDEEAVSKEKEFIALYGRIDLGSGTLANLTDGGEGTCGHKMSQGQKDKIALANKGQTRPTTGAKVSAAQRGVPNPEYQNIEHSRKMRGEGHPFWGKRRPDFARKIAGPNHPSARVVTDGGASFGCIRDLAAHLNISRSHLSSMLNGHKPNTTGFYFK